MESLSFDEGHSKERFLESGIERKFLQNQAALTQWSYEYLPDRDSRDIATSDLLLMRSGIGERRAFPSRFQYDDHLKRFYLVYDIRAHRQLAVQLLTENIEEELTVAETFLSSELAHQFGGRRRNQSNRQWAKLQANIPALCNDDEQIIADLTRNCQDLSEDFRPVLDELWHDIKDSSPERIQRINELRMSMGIAARARQEFGEVPFDEDMEASTRIFWRALGEQLWQRDLLHENGMEHEIKPIPDYLIAGSAPMTRGSVQRVAAALRTVSR